jgi:hypothetical protein
VATLIILVFMLAHEKCGGRLMLSTHEVWDRRVMLLHPFYCAGKQQKVGKGKASGKNRQSWTRKQARLGNLHSPGPCTLGFDPMNLIKKQAEH